MSRPIGIRRQQASDVVAELRRRARAGHPLNSGANRGDWIYAAALRFFGTWGAAVDAAGFRYGDVRQAALTAEDVLRRIRAAAAAGKPLRAGRESVLASGARRHFGSWKAAVEAAGHEVPIQGFWTQETVVAQIRDDHARGLSVRAKEVIERQEGLYKAARRCFGSWGAALKAADPSLPEPRSGKRLEPTERRERARGPRRRAERP